MTTPNVLVVEDDLELGSTIAELLSYKGFQSQVIQDGEAAMTWLYSHKPHAVILDMHLPKLSGDVIFNYIQNDEKMAGVTVIVATADVQIAHTIHQQGGLVLVKPFTLDQFDILINHLR